MENQKEIKKSEDDVELKVTPASFWIMIVVFILLIIFLCYQLSRL